MSAGAEVLHSGAGEAGSRLVGLLRAVDLERRKHVYGLGAAPEGLSQCELGSLLVRPPDDGLALERTAAGLLTTRAYRPARTRPTTREALRWVLGPLAWRHLGVAPRARSLGRRTLTLFSLAAGATDRSERPPPRIVGYLHSRPAPGTRPLYSALHPVTGDQLLSTTPQEATAYGYGPAELLGHLVSAAPVTGSLTVGRGAVPWARRYGTDFAGGDGLVMGAIEAPVVGADIEAETLRIAGWALGTVHPVARIEIFLDGRHAGRARLGLPREDLRAHAPAAGFPDALLAGFEYVADCSALSTGAGPLDIRAHVRTTAGHEHVLSSWARVRPRRPGPPHGESPYRAEESGHSNGARRRLRKGSRSGVLIFTHRLDHGGAQRYLFDQVRRLSAGDLGPCTVVAFSDGFWRGPLEQAGAEVHVTSSYPRTGPGEYEGRLAELQAWCSRRDFRVAFINTLDCFMGADLAKRMGLPVVWALHESFEPAVWWTVGHVSGPDGDYVHSRLCEALRAADVTIFAADATLRLFEAHLGGGRRVVAPYGLEIGEIDAFKSGFDARAERAARGFAPTDRLLVSLGILSPRKAQALVAQAFGLVAHDHPDARLCLVGDVPGPYSRALAKYLSATALDARCQLVPATSDPYAWLAMADGFVLASDIESSPISMIEAMMIGTPVLATSVFGVPELIRHGRHGFLCDPNDLDSLAAGLQSMLRASPAELEDMTGRAADLARHRHDPDRYSRNLQRVLAALADGCPVPDWDRSDETAFVRQAG